MNHPWPFKPTTKWTNMSSTWRRWRSWNNAKNAFWRSAEKSQLHAVAQSDQSAQSAQSTKAYSRCDPRLGEIHWHCETVLYAVSTSENYNYNSWRCPSRICLLQVWPNRFLVWQFYHIYRRNLNDPCFDWKRPDFGAKIEDISRFQVLLVNLEKNNIILGGFKPFFIFITIRGRWTYFDYKIFFNWVGCSTTNKFIPLFRDPINWEWLKMQPFTHMRFGDDFVGI